MEALEIALNWVHILSVTLFLGTMFLGTFVLMPVLKTHLGYEQRQQFVVNFIPRVRSFVRVYVALLLISGVGQAVLLRLQAETLPGLSYYGLFGVKLLLAAVPIVIFILAPRILGKKSKEGLCCDPDAEDPPILMGVMSSTGATLHYAAISGGWLAVLCAIILTHMR